MELRTLLIILLGVGLAASFALYQWTNAQSAQMISFINVSATHLPLSSLTGNSMDAEFGDLDFDGDLDLVVATEFGQNRILINDGTGVFADETSSRLPSARHDSEDIALADFDGDGHLDIVFVSEDDRTNEYYLNNGSGFFEDVGDRLLVAGTSNAVIAADLNGDGHADLLIGNAGQNVALINDGNGFFNDETASRLPTRNDSTQDLELGDIDGDGDDDLVVGNEDANRLYLNNGSGVFEDVSDRIPTRAGSEETREVDFGDVDGDGDLDIFFANVVFQVGSNPQNRLLINDGSGHFTDETSTRLPTDPFFGVDGDFVDIDQDGDVDLIVANAFGGGYRIFINDGDGNFEDQSSQLIPTSVNGNGIDVEVADVNGDGLWDIYLTRFGGSDYLLLGSVEQ